MASNQIDRLIDEIKGNPNLREKYYPEPQHPWGELLRENLRQYEDAPAAMEVVIDTLLGVIKVPSRALRAARILNQDDISIEVKALSQTYSLNIVKEILDLAIGRRGQESAYFFPNQEFYEAHRRGTPVDMEQAYLNHAYRLLTGMRTAAVSSLVLDISDQPGQGVGKVVRDLCTTMVRTRSSEMVDRHAEVYHNYQRAGRMREALEYVSELTVVAQTNQENFYLVCDLLEENGTMELATALFRDSENVYVDVIGRGFCLYLLNPETVQTYRERRDALLSQ